MRDEMVAHSSSLVFKEPVPDFRKEVTGRRMGKRNEKRGEGRNSIENGEGKAEDRL